MQGQQDQGTFQSLMQIFSQPQFQGLSFVSDFFTNLNNHQAQSQNRQPSSNNMFASQVPAQNEVPSQPENQQNGPMQQLMTLGIPEEVINQGDDAIRKFAEENSITLPARN